MLVLTVRLGRASKPRGFSQVEAEFSNYYWEFRLPLVSGGQLRSGHFARAEGRQLVHFHQPQEKLQQNFSSIQLIDFKNKSALIH